MRKTLKHLTRSEKATGALEFAFAVPVVLILVLGTFEFALMSFSNALLEGGLREAARFGISGMDPDDGTREEKIVEIVNSNAAGLFTVTAADIETLVYEDFSDIGEPEPYTDSNGNSQYDDGEPFTDINCNTEWDEDRGAAGQGMGEDVVLYTIVRQHKTITGIFDKLFEGTGATTMRASVAVKNEPFARGASGC